MTTRGRKPGFKLTDEHRAKIANSNILNALLEHVEGTREMSGTQVTAGLGLLRKVLPDYAVTQIENSEQGAFEIVVNIGGNASGS